MAKIREQAISLASYLDKVKAEDISENQDVQRMFCWDNSAMNELIVTVLTEDYIPPIILGEEVISTSLVQQYIVDGIQRTTTLNMFRNMNWRTTKSFENGIISYQAKKRDENGNLLKDTEGKILWESCEFDIRNKTYSQLPEELKKRFDDYQIRIVIHQNCSMTEISKLVRRYNRNKSMGVNQKALTWLPTYARKVKLIATNDFFKNCVAYSSSNRKNGAYEQAVANSVLITFHKDEWKTKAKDRNEFLENASSPEEFVKINEYGNRIAKVCGENYQSIFVFKDIPVWFAVFHEFKRLGIADEELPKFLDALNLGLKDEFVGEWSYSLLDEQKGTRDKRIVFAKIDTLIELLHRFFAEEIIMPNASSIALSSDNEIISFIKEVTGKEIEGEDLEFYRDMMEDFVRIDSPLREKCEKELIALLVYSCENDLDDIFEIWVSKIGTEINFLGNNNIDTYNKMKDNFANFVEKNVA